MKSIVVSGDVCVDWISVQVPGRRLNVKGGRAELPNWRIHDGTRMIARPGGALLLERLVRAALKSSPATNEDSVSGPRVRSLKQLSSDAIVHSMFTVGRYPAVPGAKDEEKECCRITRFDGAHGPAEDSIPTIYERCDTQKMRAADLVVLDDAGNGFRSAKGCWPPVLSDPAQSPWVVLKMSQPLAVGALWDFVIERHRDRLITVVDAGDLRELYTQISEGLSWERTATDTYSHLTTNQELAELCRSRHVIVRFGCEGALHHYSDDDGRKTCLYFTPDRVEGGTAERYPGKMTGLTAAFCASIVKHLTTAGAEGIAEGIREGMQRSQALYHLGFSTDKHGDVDYPCEALFTNSLGDVGAVASTDLDEFLYDSGPGSPMWSIAAERLGSGAGRRAREVVVQGYTEPLRDAPVGVFGGLETVDRGEIESYRTIRNLIAEYQNDPNPKRPLCIAVFGPPGAGKSFGVKQVAKSLDGASISEEGVEFNVSQFNSPADLVRALHRVRDSVLRGKTPLVFFDEFDSAAGGARLGWLKYFLMPMQDGEFRDGDVVHPIGKSIFVFAGGVFESLEDFMHGRTSTAGGEIGTGEIAHGDLSDADLKDTKVPDFVSRLRGFVNVTGPNPFDPITDHLFQIRRALMLRSLLKKKRPNLFSANDGGPDMLDMDACLIDALIHVPRYKHGARSMEAIIDMSATTGRDRFEQSALPPAPQLDLHVDARTFLELLQLGPCLEEMAQEVHRAYRATGQAHPSSDKDWDELDEDLRDSNRQQVFDIPSKVHRVGLGIVRTLTPTNFGGFTEADVELLAPLEHERWYAERSRSGWRPGKPRDNARKIHPLMVPWDELSPEKQELDRAAVRHIPDILRLGGLKLVRLEPSKIPEDNSEQPE